MACRAPAAPLSGRGSRAPLGLAPVAAKRRALDRGTRWLRAVRTRALDGDRGDDSRGAHDTRARAAGQLRRIGRDADAVLSVRAVPSHGSGDGAAALSLARRA